MAHSGVVVVGKGVTLPFIIHSAENEEVYSANRCGGCTRLNGEAAVRAGGRLEPLRVNPPFGAKTT